MCSKKLYKSYFSRKINWQVNQNKASHFLAFFLALSLFRFGGESTLPPQAAHAKPLGGSGSRL